MKVHASLPSPAHMVTTSKAWPTSVVLEDLAEDELRILGVPG